MEATVQSSKPTTTQDAVLGLVSSTRNQEDGERFEKVFEEASQKLESDDSESSIRTEEDEEKVKKDDKHVKEKMNDLESGEGLAGLVRSTEVQKKTVDKVVRVDPKQKQQVQNGEKNKPLQKQKRVKEEISASEVARAEASLKKQRVRAAAQKSARANQHSELVKADRVKADQIREQNGPFKPQQISQSNVSPTLNKSLSPEYHAKDGTQNAQDQGNMMLSSKQNAPKPEARPLLVDELRPATGAETASKSTNQQGQQDLSREPVKEQILPVSQVQSSVASANGVASTQSMTPTGGVASPMLEKIWDAVTTFRIRGDNEMVLKVQPDNDTEMQLTIKYGAGGVEIEARMQQGDGRQLASGWNELQQQLSERGVNLGELSSDGTERGANGSDSRQFNRHSHHNNYEIPEFQIRDDEGDWAALGMAATREQEKTKSVKESTDKIEEAYDGWQSWA
tara:strand:+ start:990 stop:2348 length:1359 start_codon:yes stop_codon:yes gene_type:complete